MAKLPKRALRCTVLGAMLLYVALPLAGQRTKAPKAPTSLSQEELRGLVHCLRHCGGEDVWVGPSFGRSKRLHLHYQVGEWDPTRSGFYIVATVYSEKANSGLYFDLTWDGKRCGRFAVINDGQFSKKHGAWRWTTRPLGGIGTLKEATNDLRSVMSRGHSVTMNADTREKGCGEWSSY